MLKLLSTVISRPVISQRDSAAIGTVREAICDPAAAKLIAYRVSTGSGFLATTDVLAYLDDGLVVASGDSIQAEDDLVRVKRLGADRTGLFKVPVITEQGQRLGAVNDVLIETDGHFVTRLHVRPRFPVRFFMDERIIPRERIIRMTAREVIVRYDGKARSVSAEPEVAQ